MVSDWIQKRKQTEYQHSSLSVPNSGDKMANYIKHPLLRLPCHAARHLWTVRKNKPLLLEVAFVRALRNATKVVGFLLFLLFLPHFRVLCYFICFILFCVHVTRYRLWQPLFMETQTEGYFHSFSWFQCEFLIKTPMILALSFPLSFKIIPRTTIYIDFW